MGAIISIKVAYQKPIFRSSERISVTKDTKVSIKYKSKSLDAILVDISEIGAGLKLNKDIYIEPGEIVTLSINNIDITCEITRINKSLLGVKFNFLSPNQMKAIMSIFTENMMPYYNTYRVQTYSASNSKNNMSIA
ncbi:PilZ domain-containing protein [Romboutsia sp. CE17]|uniref:PilZ domain-containing protein n=1 Tax=Romboutsia sp. CE17 TaxID=2724150 RepID=UPI001442C07D|nr:PilZ domain-containing protein [Romboutsia sp. CE17]QJA08758.1 PilZ domain-containing protein [Romboutsia sp. CE17]